jgi:hypothetical protein
MKVDENLFCTFCVLEPRVIQRALLGKLRFGTPPKSADEDDDDELEYLPISSRKRYSLM